MLVPRREASVIIPSMSVLGSDDLKLNMAVSKRQHPDTTGGI